MDATLITAITALLTTGGAAVRRRAWEPLVAQPREQKEPTMSARIPRVLRSAVNGRRGAFQALFAASYLAIGFSYLFVPSSPSREQALAWLTVLVPLKGLGLMWVLAGLFGLWGARRPRPKDEWSFIALTLAPTVWGFLYVGAVVFGTYPNGWVTSVLYWCIAGAVMVVSGMTGDGDRDDRAVKVVGP